MSLNVVKFVFGVGKVQGDGLIIGRERSNPARLTMRRFGLASPVPYAGGELAFVSKYLRHVNVFRPTKVDSASVVLSEYVSVF